MTAWTVPRALGQVPEPLSRELDAMLHSAGLAQTRVHASSMAGRLPELDGPGAGVRELFILFYFVIDDMCVSHHRGHVAVDRRLVDETRSCITDILETGVPARGASAPGRLFHFFWGQATRVVPQAEHDRLARELNGLADAMHVKYQLIANPEFPSPEDFIPIRRRVPAASFIELERMLRAIPPADAALVSRTQAVADCLSWTNDLHSAEKEQHEGFNLVHVIRRARGATLSEAKEEVRRLLITRERMYKNACRVVGGNKGQESARLLSCYDDLLAVVAPVYEQERSRYQ